MAKDFTKLFLSEFNNLNYLNKSLYCVLSITLFLGLYFGEDTSGGGTVIDFEATFPFVQNPFLVDGIRNWYFPLHYYITGFFYYILGDKDYLRLLFVIISLFIPPLFYICLSNKYKKTDKNNLFLFSLILFLMPALRTSAIWPNSHLTATIFFLFALLFFIKWENESNFKKINTNLLLSLIFMALAVYTRQLYAIVYLFFVYFFFKKMRFETFLKTSLIIFILAIPGLYIVSQWPRTLSLSFSFNLQNSFIVNTSIISFYLIPFFLINLLIDKKFIFKKKDNLVILLICSISIVFLSQYFTYDYKYLGGGAFIKFSHLVFNNLYFFYITSIAGLTLTLILIKNNLGNFVISFLVIFGFSASILPQKYFEPFFLILLFLIFKSKHLKSIIEDRQKIKLSLIYFSFYLIAAVINDIYNFNSNL